MKPKPYTEEETAILRAIYPVQGVRAVQERLPHRSLISIQVMASKLGVKSPLRNGKPWSAGETDQLAAESRFMSHAEIGEELGRSLDAVYAKARREGFLPGGKGFHWTEEEDQFLHASFSQGLSLEQVTAAMPLRTLQGVMARARRIGAWVEVEKNWSPDELSCLQSYLGDSTAGFPQLPGRSVGAIKGKLKRLRALGRTALPA